MIFHSFLDEFNSYDLKMMERNTVDNAKLLPYHYMTFNLRYTNYFNFSSEKQLFKNTERQFFIGSWTNQEEKKDSFYLHREFILEGYLIMSFI